MKQTGGGNEFNVRTSLNARADGRSYGTRLDQVGWLFGHVKSIGNLNKLVPNPIMKSL